MKCQCPNQGQKRKENIRTVTVKYEEENQGQNDAFKEKVNDAPGPPSYNAHAFINHIQTLGAKERDKVLDKIMMIKDF